MKDDVTYQSIQQALLDGNISEAEHLVRDAMARWRGRKACADLLVRAAQENVSTLVALILDQGCPPDEVGSDGYTALEVACYRGNREAVEVLLNRGASASRLGKRRGGPTALMQATFYEHEALVDMLLRAGADPREVGELAVSSLLRIRGSILRRIVAAGGSLHPDIQRLLDARQALGD